MSSSSCCNGSVHQGSTMKRVVGYGEAMLRYIALDDDEGRGKPSAAARVLRTVAGDELNVMVALAKLGGDVQGHFITVLPDSNHGASIIEKCAEDAGVSMRGSVRVSAPNMLGTFTVLPHERRVEYQRSASAFWQSDAHRNIDWQAVLSGASWLHATGITPMCGKHATKAWIAHVETAVGMGVPVSCDLNHRPALGKLIDLWSFVSPFVSRGHFQVLILSKASLAGLLKLLGVVVGGSATNEEKLQKLQAAIGEQCSPLACCFKTRDADGVQTRWSIVCERGVCSSTIDAPTIHVPKDECGGGSAWAAGIIDLRLRGADWMLAQRAGDALAALTQEIEGDHGDVSRKALESALESPSPPPTSNPDDLLRALGESGVVAIIRAKNAKVALARAIELVNLGCAALEVTMDSANLSWLLPSIVEAVGDRCIVGVGTVMSVQDLEAAAAMGARFALSPINPPGFVKRCLELGVLSVPAAYTPQEIFDAHAQGAHLIKLFPAQLWNPSTLKALKGVGEFKNVKILPSGALPAKAPSSGFALARLLSAWDPA